MENSTPKIMSFSSQRECEEDRTQLKLHCDETENSLQTFSQNIDNI